MDRPLWRFFGGGGGTVRHCVPSSQIPRVFTMSQGAPLGALPDSWRWRWDLNPR